MSNTGVVAFSFGTPAELHSNRIIGQIASEQASKVSGPIYVEEVLQIHIYASHDCEYSKGTNTLRVARGAARWAKRRRIQELWVAAANPHQRRCVRDLKYALAEVDWSATVRVCPKIFEHPSKDWYRPEATQKRVHNRIFWWCWELLLRWMGMKLYTKLDAWRGH